MKHYFTISLLIFISFGCSTERKESYSDEPKESNIEKSVAIEATTNDDSVLVKDSVFINSTTQRNPSSEIKVIKKDTSKKEKTIVKTKLPDIDQIVQTSKEERKPPLIIKNIQWLNEEMILTYKKTIYPKPGVGCSSSNESLVLRVPISKPEGKIVLNNDQLRNSSLNYSYSGGLYGKSSLDSPPSGKIVLSPMESGIWEVDIDIKFLIVEMGGMEQKNEIEEFKFSDTFD